MPRSPLHFSDHPTVVCRCCLLLWPIRAAPALRKTRNQLYSKIVEAADKNVSKNKRGKTKKEPDLQAVNHRVLQQLHPEQVAVEIWRAEELEVRRGLSSELDEMWSYVHSKANPRWLWHAIDHHTGKVLAYVFGRRKDTVFLT